MSSRIPTPLDQMFECVPQAGRVALLAKSGPSLSMFKTKRVGKLMPNGKLPFTIGATLAGQSCNLNGTIQAIIRAEGMEVLDRETTSGSRGYEAQYPSVQITGLSDDAIGRIVHRIEGAIFQMANNGAG